MFPHSRIAGLLLLALAAACSRASDPPAPPDLRPHVTGAAASAVGADGLFVLPAAEAPSTLPIIDERRARDLAAAYVRSFGPLLRGRWETERGRAIVIGRLAPQERSLFATTPFDPLPEGYHPAYQRAFGPYHILGMSDGLTSDLLVAVAAYKDELFIDGEGLLQLPPFAGMEFVSSGVPVQVRLPLLLSPERAVVHVGRVTGARISEIPVLQQVGVQLGPLQAVWRLALDRDVRVRVREGGRVAEVRVLYLSPEPGIAISIPALDQPDVITISAVRTSLAGGEPVRETVLLPVRAGHAVFLEEVDLAP